MIKAVALIILVSVLPILIEIYRGWRARRRGETDDEVSDDSAGRHRA